MELSDILCLICFCIGSSLLVCGLATFLRIGYKYIMYELYNRSTYDIIFIILRYRCSYI